MRGNSKDKKPNKFRKWVRKPLIPTGDETFAFVYSPGRCGTQHLAKVFGDDNSYVCHEEEFKEIYWVMEKYLRPIARTNNKKKAMQYVRKYKIPEMLRRMDGVSAINYFGTGHQINFGLVPALLTQLGDQIKFIRLRRNRYETALSFVASPEKLDPWLSHWDYPKKIQNFRRRWAFCPKDAIVHLQPSPKIWCQLNRFQRYLWAIDEVERQWKSFLEEFTFPYIELWLENLNTRCEYDRIANFLGICYDDSMLGIHHNSTDSIADRQKPNYSHEAMEAFDKEYHKLLLSAEDVVLFPEAK